jgi:cytochrome c553
VTAVANSLNDDPNRPTLHRGKPTNAMNDDDIPKLSGLPVDQDLHQMVAVSDATNRPPHDFSRAWEDEAEHQAILGKMQAAARAQLAAYGTPHPAPAATTPAPTAQNKRSPNSKLRRDSVHEKPAAAPEPLVDEELRGFTLSYGGAATYVYHAHTDGLGPALRYVTIVAQVNMLGEPEIAMKNVTDATHLDQTPRLRLVDAVDAEASNRASLLFELRAQNSRQFALYRVIGARADQTYITGSTQ